MTAKNNIKTDHESAERKLKDHFGTDTPFAVPEGYFEKLPEMLLEKAKDAKDQANTSRRAIPIFRRFAVAASVLIIAGLAALMLLTRQEQVPEMAEDFTFMEVYRFNFGNLAELEEAYILSLAGEEAGEDLFSVPVDTTGISQEDMINYLLAENHIEYLTLSNNKY